MTRDDMVLLLSLLEISQRPAKADLGPVVEFARKKVIELEDAFRKLGASRPNCGCAGFYCQCQSGQILGAGGVTSHTETGVTDAVKEGVEPKGDRVEHQGANGLGPSPETSDSHSLGQGGQKPKKRGRPKKA